MGEGVALSGFDPVSYFSPTGPEKGQGALSLVHEGATYHFATAAHRDRFAADPEAYLPACGGWCARAMLDGDKVDVNPERFKIHEGRLLLFYDGFWGNTLERWNEKARDTPEAELVDRVMKNWDALVREHP